MASSMPGLSKMCVKVGQWVSGRSAVLSQKLKLLGEKTSDNTSNTLTPQRQSTSNGSNNNGTGAGTVIPENPDTSTDPDNSLTLQHQSTSDGSNEIRIVFGSIIAENPDTDPNNARQRQSTSYNDARNDILKVLLMMSKLMCAANLVLIVGIVFDQIFAPKHPYRWIAIAEAAIQSIALGAMMMGFHLGPKYVMAAIWSHRTGHLFFLEGIAVALVCRFHWPARLIPLVLLPVPAVLIPVYIFV